MWASAKRESFIREMLCFIEFAKVFTRESFRLYGNSQLQEEGAGKEERDLVWMGLQPKAQSLGSGWLHGERGRRDLGEKERTQVFCQ